jgi:hypothetical protein
MRIDGRFGLETTHAEGTDALPKAGRGIRIAECRLKHAHRRIAGASRAQNRRTRPKGLDAPETPPSERLSAPHDTPGSGECADFSGKGRPNRPKRAKRDATRRSAAVNGAGNGKPQRHGPIPPPGWVKAGSQRAGWMIGLDEGGSL